MGWVSGIAVYFIIWWVVLFIMLPIGVRSQVEEDDVTLGTEHGAPARPMMARKMLLTTLVSFVVFGIFYYVTIVQGYGIHNLPQIVPDFSHTRS